MARRLRIVVVVGLFVSVATSTPAQVPEDTHVVRQTSLDKSSLTDAIEGIRSSLNIPSMAVSIFDADGTMYRRTLGEASAESRFYVGSITKALTATLIMQLVEDGTLRLDDPAREHVSFDLPRQLRIVDLLHHRSGIPRSMGYVSWSGGPADLETHVESLDLETGAHTFEYSNLNYEILGRIIEEVTGRPYREALRAHLLDPLGMDQTHAAISPREVPKRIPGHQYLFGATTPSSEAPYREWEIPSRFAAMSIRDAARLGQLHLAEGALEDSRLLEAAHVRRMFEPPEKNTGHAMGWFVERHGDLQMVRHEGLTTSYHASMALLPERELGVVVLANVNSYGAGAAGMLAENLALMAAGEQTETLTNFEFVLRLALGVLLAVVILWFAIRLYNWAQRSFRVGLVAGAWRRLVPTLVLAAAIVVGVPRYFGVPLVAIWTLQPDLALGLVLVPVLSWLSMLLDELRRFAEIDAEPTVS